MQNALKGIGKVMRRNGLTIAPDRIPQVECPFICRSVMLPSFCHAGMHEGVILGIRADQALQESGNDFAVSHGRGLVRVKAEGLLIVSHDENALLRR